MRAKVDHVTDCVFLSDWRRKLSLRREFFTCVLAAPATLPLRRSSGCARRWLDGKIKTGDPLSSFPIRSSVRCNALLLPPGTLRGVCPRLWSPSPAAAEAPRWVRSRESHIDLADGLETGSPYFHLYSPGLALSRDTHSFCDDLAGGENSLWGGSFHLRSSQHLPRCRWGGAVAVLADGLDGRLRRVIPYLLFPSDPASAAMHCAPAGHAPRSVSAPMNLALPLLLRHRGEWDHGDRT